MRRSRLGSLEERFWRRVEKRGEDDCWNWTGARQGPNGYGVISGEINGVRHVPVGTNMLVHRVSWILHNGPIPEGAGAHGTVVMHTCDNRSCVNPNHLRLGTQKENIDDMNAKKRGVIDGIVHKKGFAHPRSVVTPEMVQAIRSSEKPGGELAAEFGISRDTIRRVRQGATYASEQEAAVLRARKKVILPDRSGFKGPTSKLTPEILNLIRESPLSTHKLAAQLGLNQTTVARARRGATYKRPA